MDKPRYISTFSNRKANGNPELLSSQDYYSFGMQMPDRGTSVGLTRDYRFGFNGKENDNEVKGSGNSLDFGARIYDARLGRWWRADAVIKADLTPYQFGINNPMIFIDPDGDTEFYFNGKWIGTDGQDNNMLGLVTDRGLKKLILADTKAGQTVPARNWKNGEEFGGVFAVHKNVIIQSSKVLKDQLDEGQTKEFKAVMKKNIKTGNYETIYEGVGPDSETLKGRESVSGGNLPEGDVSMHGHPTGAEVDQMTGITYSGDASEPSPGIDKPTFENYEMNIIVGKNGKAQAKGEVSNAATGAIEWKVNDTRGNYINFFDSNTKLKYSLSEGSAKTIKSGNKGKLFEKYNKAKSK